MLFQKKNPFPCMDSCIGHACIVVIFDYAKLTDLIYDWQKLRSIDYMKITFLFLFPFLDRLMETNASNKRHLNAFLLQSREIASSIVGKTDSLNNR